MEKIALYCFSIWIFPLTPHLCFARYAFALIEGGFPNSLIVILYFGSSKSALCTYACLRSDLTRGGTNCNLQSWWKECDVSFLHLWIILQSSRSGWGRGLSFVPDLCDFGLTPSVYPLLLPCFQPFLECFSFQSWNPDLCRSLISSTFFLKRLHTSADHPLGVIHFWRL